MTTLEIERKLLYQLINSYGTNNDKVIKQSQKLDKLIVQETKKINIKK